MRDARYRKNKTEDHNDLRIGADEPVWESHLRFDRPPVVDQREPLPVERCEPEGQPAYDHIVGDQQLAEHRRVEPEDLSVQQVDSLIS